MPPPHNQRFRTLYVEVYRWIRNIKNLSKIFVSVHYMLRFILEWHGNDDNMSLFPYIICWGLSYLHTPGLPYLNKFPYIICWGLSAVLCRRYRRFRLFPYIICWGLSLGNPWHCLFFPEFPYIICWGLSQEQQKGEVDYEAFPYIICWGLSNWKSTFPYTV